MNRETIERYEYRAMTICALVGAIVAAGIAYSHDFYEIGFDGPRSRLSLIVLLGLYAIPFVIGGFLGASLVVLPATILKLMLPRSEK